MSLEDRISFADFQPSWKQPLVSLDYYLWELHGKIADKAAKTLGWSNYDCAGKMGFAAGAVFFTGGAFIGATVPAAYENSDYAVATCGSSAALLMMLFGLARAYSGKYLSKIDEEQAIAALARGQGVKEPYFSGKRIAEICMGIGSSSLGIDNLTRLPYSAEFLEMSPAEKQAVYAAGGYMLVAVGAALLLQVSENYFTDQIYKKPPKAKRSIFQVLYEGAKSLLPEKAPVPVPAETRYVVTK